MYTEVFTISDTFEKHISDIFAAIECVSECNPERDGWVTRTEITDILGYSNQSASIACMLWYLFGCNALECAYITIEDNPKPGPTRQVAYRIV